MINYSKKSNYLIKLNEFEELGKSPYIAAILSLFLGLFGVHRFYLKRILSGFIFLIISLSSFQYGEGDMAAILVIITFIESMVYLIKGTILLIIKHKNISGDKTMNRLHDQVKQDEFEQMTMTIGFEENEIIDVSDIKPTKIVKEGNADWISKLELPYDIKLSDLSQIEKEVFILYTRLCDFIDEELRRKRSSLNKENKVKSNRYYYSDLFGTIYHIGSSHVFKVYSRNYNYYNPEYYYRILETQFNKSLRNKIYTKAQELEKEISPPTEETYRYFNLTNHGTPIEWWDKDGELRRHIKFTEIELNILKITPPRNTKPWEFYIVRKYMINLYLDIWKIIYEGLNKDYKWRIRIKSSLEDVIIGEEPHYADFVDNNILEGLLKLTENTVRGLMPNIQILNIDKDETNIQKYLPKEIVSDIYNLLSSYKENISNEELKNIVISMLDKNPNDWKLKVNLILMTEKENQITQLIAYANNCDFAKVAKELVKKADNEDLILICLYSIEREEKLTQKNNKLLESIIDPSNISQYKNLLESKETLSIELINKLIAFKEPVRKKIDLDMEKIEISKKELKETVEIVKEYIGEESNIDENEIITEDKVEVEEYNTSIEFKYEKFLKLVLDYGFLDIEEGKKIAMENGTLLNAFISDINRELYDYVNDQVIIIEEENIKIDDFYIDMVKELITNEA